MRIDNLIQESQFTNEGSLRETMSFNIYRYKFTVEFMEKLYEFSKIHQYDDRIAFKENWNKWIEDNDDAVKNEILRLNNTGYEGDVLDKMFKSARYYFRKKSITKNEPKKRRVYVSCQKDMLDEMDSHIINGIKSTDFKPSSGFDEFCIKNADLLKEEISHLIQAEITETRDIFDKIKKTYKNRYFNISNKQIN